MLFCLVGLRTNKWNVNQVMLYDEADNLLESRMLKADEVVSSGETLTFQAYLVDICEPKEGSKASSDLKVESSDQGCVRKPFAVLRPNFKKSSLYCGMIPILRIFSGKCLLLFYLFPFLFLQKRRNQTLWINFLQKVSAHLTKWLEVSLVALVPLYWWTVTPSSIPSKNFSKSHREWKSSAAG